MWNFKFFLITLIALLKCSETDLKRVFIVTRDGCPYSEMMRIWLLKNDVPSTDYNISETGIDIRSKLKRPEATFPLVFIKNTKNSQFEYIGGYEDFIEMKDKFMKSLKNTK